MKEIYQQAQQFLNDILINVELDLQAEAVESENGCILNLDGADSPLLRSEGGELLDALDHIINQAFARGLPEKAQPQTAQPTRVRSKYSCWVLFRGD